MRTRPWRLRRADVTAYTPSMRSRPRTKQHKPISDLPDLSAPAERAQWLNVRESQVLLGISISAVGRWAEKEQWRYFRDGRRYYYARADVEAHRNKYTPQSKMLTIREVAARSSKTTDAVRRLIIAGRLPARKLRGWWHVSEADLNRANDPPRQGRTHISPQNVIDALNSAGHRLSKREREILQLRYDPDQQFAQTEIAARWNLTRARIHQIEHAGLTKLGLIARSGKVLEPQHAREK